MRKILISIGLMALFAMATQIVYAAPTTNVLRGGITINEIGYDEFPNLDGNNNGTGGEVNQDEFVELINIGGAPIDVAGLILTDCVFGEYTIAIGDTPAGTTTIGSGSYATLVNNNGVADLANLQTTMDAGSIAITWTAAIGLAEAGETIFLYDPATDEYIGVAFHGTAPIDPTVEAGCPSITATATEVGIDAVALLADGVSITRSPVGDTNWVLNAPGAESPTAVTFAQQAAESATPMTMTLLLIAVLSIGTAIALGFRSKSTQ